MTQVCKINDVVSENPSFCFIDWFSSGLLIINKTELFKILDAVVRKLMLINCNICFLLLDRKDMCKQRIQMYDLVIEYADLYKLNVLKMYNNNNVSELLRDTVHTNEKGAKFYSDKIFDFFINNLTNNHIIYNKIPEENEFCNVKSISINKIINNEIELRGNFNIIGIYQKIGKFSGLIEITRNNLNPYIYSVWDQWCHYERDNIKISIPYSENVKIKILQDLIDTKDCKSDIHFDQFEKYMHIYEIYYLGDLYIECIN
jgi:hypothetical protein